MTKICSKCKIEKDISEYFKDARYKLDKLRIDCKTCYFLNKKCTKCGIKKGFVEFSKNKSKNDGLHSECKNCNKQNNKNFYTIHKKEISKINQQYEKKKMKTDPLFKLAKTIRIRLRCAIKNNKKAGSFIRDLGCSIEFLKTYLESKFIEGMSWENHGKWHLDHVLPLSSFDLTDRERFLKACHYTNLQPLWAIDNIKKGAKIIQ